MANAFFRVYTRIVSKKVDVDFLAQDVSVTFGSWCDHKPFGK